jgi:hypothetical protein
LTAEGHPRSVFYRAIERGNLLAALDAIRHMGVVTLQEALQMTALVALRDRDRLEPWARRWLVRFLEERQPSLDESALAAASLAALGGPGHHVAVAALTDMAEQASRPPDGDSVSPGRVGVSASVFGSPARPYLWWVDDSGANSREHKYKLESCI